MVSVCLRLTLNCYDLCSSPPWDSLFLLLVKVLWRWCINKGWEKVMNIGERVLEWMVCHSDSHYLHHSHTTCNYWFSKSEWWELLPPSSSTKSGCTILVNLPVFEIVFAASIVLYHHCCAALSCTATPVL